MILGIDLGTTNSAVGIWREGAVELIPNSLGDCLTPSAVSLDEDGALLVGRAARERQVTHPDRTATAFKRYIGTSRNTRLGDRDFLPEELSALVLRSLKADAEDYLGAPVGEAVITVPAYFNDKQRRATRRAGELAGLKVERLLNEPTAAALAYGLNELEVETRFLVFDLGGGTFDVSIVELFEGVIEVRASTGDNQLGGEDFNDILARRFRERLPKTHEGRADAETRERLRLAAERVRRVLSEQAEAMMSVKFDQQLIEQRITADEFEAWCEPLLKRLREPVLRAFRDSGLRSEDLSEILLVGGATRMPVVRKAVTKMFGRFPAHVVDPDQAVAIGAAIQAGLKSRDAALKEVVLTNVCPYSLGIETGELGVGGSIRKGLFSPILERGTVIPASRSKSFFSLQDGQRSIKVTIYQGEARSVADNVRLGELDATVPPAPAGQGRIDVRFTYDINGLLEVETFEPTGGDRRELLILDDDTITPKELARRRAALAALKVNPRDEDANREALARATRIFELTLGEERDQ
ncbi:MAG: Hsp70 family protein, partial [Caulobacteraceae bacterium]